MPGSGRGEFPVAIPEALFKIVVREGEQGPEALAFLYPQTGPGYLDKPYGHARYLTTIDEIEELTGLDFLGALPFAQQAAIEGARAEALWEAEEEDHIAACGSGLHLNE